MYLLRCQSRPPKNFHADALRTLPPVGREEQVNHVILQISLALQIAIDHLTDGRRPV